MGPNAIYTSEKKLYVGCPSEIVTITEGGYLDAANSDTQYVDINDADSTK